MNQTISTDAPPQGLFFGWRIVAASFLVTFTIYGVSIFAFIVLIQALAAQRGWTPADTGGLVSAMWLAAPLALVAGPLAQRVSPWRLITLGILLQAAVVVAMLAANELWQIYLLRFAMGVGKVLAIVGLPMLVSRWFSMRFATAMAIVWAGGSAGGLVLSPVMDWLIVSFGWQKGALIIAAGVLASLVVIQLIARGPGSPEEIGLGRDGITRNAPDGAAVVSNAATGGPSARQVLGTISLPTAAIMFIAIAGAGVASIAIFSMEPALLEKAGFSSGQAATLLGLTAAGSFVGSVSIGWLLDRFNTLVSDLIAALAIGLGLLVFVFLFQGPNFPLALFGALACGFGAGSGEVLWINLTKRQFGEGAFSITYGGWFIALQLGYAIGGSVAGWSFSQFGAMGFLGFVAIIYLLPAFCSVAIRAGRLPPISQVGQI